MNLAHIICYQCGNTGHYTRNCPTRNSTVNLIDFNQMEFEQTTKEDRVARLKAKLRQMSNKKKERLAQELGGTLKEDSS
jgi:hypothetical protein